MSKCGRVEYTYVGTISADKINNILTRVSMLTDHDIIKSYNVRNNKIRLIFNYEIELCEEIHDIIKEVLG